MITRRHIFTLSVILAVMCGCALEKTSVPPADRGHSVTFTLVSSAAQANPSRAAGEQERNENAVKKLDIFFFATDGQCLHYPEVSQIAITGTTVTVTIPGQTAKQLFGRPLTLYVLANSETDRNQLDGKTLTELRRIVQHNSTTLNPDPYIHQDAFLMDGTLQIDEMSVENTSFSTLYLSRAAAKIEVTITGAKVQGYIATNAKVSLNNYLDKTVVGSEAAIYVPQQSDFLHSGRRDIWYPGSGSPSFSTPPFYSYANDWETVPERESYITIAVEWARESDGYTRYYYYRVPFNYIPAQEGGSNLLRIKRNHIYKFNVDISVLGGLDPQEMVDLSPNFEIKDWTTHEIEVKINQYGYLFVAENHVEMHDITYRQITYTSSSAVEIINLQAYYYRYKSNGDIETVYYSAGDNAFPSVVPVPENSAICLTSPLPTNYVPVYIEFTVRNQSGIAQNVRVVQYPRQYITSEWSAGITKHRYYGDSYWVNNGQGNATMKNFNFYTVTTTRVAEGDPFVIGTPKESYTSSDIYDPIRGVWGFTTNVTKADEMSNMMISPKFVIASQRGITTNNTRYESAKHRCAIYNEGPYPVGTWRVPTTAELELIARLQLDEGSAIKNLFQEGANYGSKHWWTARHEVIDGWYYFYQVNVVEGGVKRTVTQVPGDVISSVRCVRDVWED